MKKYFIPVIIGIFIVLSIGFYVLQMLKPAFSFGVLMAGNIIMALLSLGTFFMVRKQINKRPEAFVRGVYSSSFLKLMVCMIAILVYVLTDKDHIYKPSVFVLFGIYAVYTVFETWLLSQMAREGN